MASGTEAMGVTGVPFSMTCTTLFLKVRERLVLLDPHLGVHFLIELCCHLYKRETLTLKKKKKGKEFFSGRTKHLLFSSISIARKMKEEGSRLRL